MNETKFPDNTVFGLDIGTRSVVGTVGYRKPTGEFVILAQKSECHETRAMLDGQIHDIKKVTDTVCKVKFELERELETELSEVCIAAAGRVLKTVNVRMDYDLGDEMVITEDMIYAMELMGMEQAHARLRAGEKDGTEYFCVGYSVVKYYLGNVQFTNLEGHRGSMISADVIATFLPRDVIDGLYTVCENSGLKVINLTLEPIAAINIAIPEKFRLLNLALVDIGAGTSDICITKEGSIIGYGMLPCAGDFLTESIMYELMTDFATAENIKLASSTKRKKISYTDVMGTRQTVESSKVTEILNQPFEKLTGLIADKIRELNGGERVGAVFIVGGGGKNPMFSGMLSKALGLPDQRVALRGEEVFTRIITPDHKPVKDPMLVTPIGICLNYYEQNNNFIIVKMNGVDIKLYDNGKLNVMDAIVSFGLSEKDVFPKRGKELNFTLNGKKQTVKGKKGEYSVITVNDEEGGVTTPIKCNDRITIKPSTAGAEAECRLSELKEIRDGICFIINGKRVRFNRICTVNGEFKEDSYSVCEGDEISVYDHYPLEKLITVLNASNGFKITVNNRVIDLDSYDREEKIYENYIIDIEAEAKKDFSEMVKDARDVIVPESSDGETVVDDREMLDGEDYEAYLDRRYGQNQFRSVKKNDTDDGKGSFSHLTGAEINAMLAADRMDMMIHYKELSKKSEELTLEIAKIREANERLNAKSEETDSVNLPQDIFKESAKTVEKTADVQKNESIAAKDDNLFSKEVILTVNQVPVHLLGKKEYTFVDVLDFYPFNTSSLQGTRIVCKKNGAVADFFTPVGSNDVLELFWAND
ncbi:MAG: rod shape-determining protein [Lachnospiraceae bacterium]|nr:rod shape-determining protein [Lachnospiraceae bacterium]